MLKEIIDEIEKAIDSAFVHISKEDYLSYVLLIGRADVIPEYKQFNQTEYVIDYQLDRYHDETRENFYLHYLNRNYTKDGFCYKGEDGIDDLSIEMMIYDHLWDSVYFLKSLLRIAYILSGKGYMWKPEIPENGKWKYLNDHIINPLINNGHTLGEVVQKAYSSDIRNSFAHSLYNINSENRTITIRPKSGTKTVSFDDFQKKLGHQQNPVLKN